MLSIIGAIAIISRDLDHIEAPLYSAKAHSQIVNAIDGVGGLNVGGGAPELVTGSRDGKYESNKFKMERVLAGFDCHKLI